MTCRDVWSTPVPVRGLDLRDELEITTVATDEDGNTQNVVFIGLLTANEISGEISGDFAGSWTAERFSEGSDMEFSFGDHSENFISQYIQNVNIT